MAARGERELAAAQQAAQHRDRRDARLAAQRRLTSASTADGRGSNWAPVLAVWRTSDVSAAAATPLPVTSPRMTTAPSATAKTS